jgi:hypothetical protein
MNLSPFEPIRGLVDLDLSIGSKTGSKKAE